MTDEAEDIGGGAELWNRARAPWRAAQVATLGAAREPDATTLAAYLDGGLDEAAAETVEAWMAADPDALDTVLAARAALAEAATAPVPAHMVARAQDTVRGRAGQASRANDVLGALGGLLRMRPAAWAGAAVALLLASVSGFELGRAGAETMATLDATVSQDLRLVMGRNGPDLL